ncbi:MAG: hypothetical protein QG605_820 [Euryarchaeota archaeon]|nr:hypothetical protein [Euryarchaeota archaeon]
MSYLFIINTFKLKKFSHIYVLRCAGCIHMADRTAHLTDGWNDEQYTKSLFYKQMLTAAHVKTIDCDYMPDTSSAAGNSRNHCS